MGADAVASCETAPADLIARWLIIIVALRVLWIVTSVGDDQILRGWSADLRLFDHGIGIAKIAAR
jgi:hypothetical protein